MDVSRHQVIDLLPERKSESAAAWMQNHPERRKEQAPFPEPRVPTGQLPPFNAAYLVQAFGRIARKREGHRLEDWKKQVEISRLSEVQRFAKGLERDKEAVLAGLTESYSNGMTEGFVNKLKLIKRQGYGRASFPCFVNGCCTRCRTLIRRKRTTET